MCLGLGSLRWCGVAISNFYFATAAVFGQIVAAWPKFELRFTLTPPKGRKGLSAFWRGEKLGKVLFSAVRRHTLGRGHEQSKNFEIDTPR